LHYIENQDELIENELLLVDAGAEFDSYAADITRTWPISGKFTDPQKEIYQLVLEVQLACIDMVKPGVKFWDIHEKSIELITKGLIKYGILKGEYAKIIEDKGYKRFYPHGLGHWLGIDTHDTSYLDRKIEVLKSGHYFTVEPGIYITDEDDIPEKYRKIAVRIEDDVLVTENGYEILTKDVVKEIGEIENLVGTHLLP
jgi:Xaa-Pro aminopeptidase